MNKGIQPDFLIKGFYGLIDETIKSGYISEFFVDKYKNVIY